MRRKQESQGPWRRIAVGFASLGLAAMIGLVSAQARAIQTTGAPGAPDATTTIPGDVLPPFRRVQMTQARRSLGTKIQAAPLRMDPMEDSRGPRGLRPRPHRRAAKNSVSIPRQSRGLYDWGRSKRPLGGANATPLPFVA